MINKNCFWDFRWHIDFGWLEKASSSQPEDVEFFRSGKRRGTVQSAVSTHCQMEETDRETPVMTATRGQSIAAYSKGEASLSNARRIPQSVDER